MDKLKGPSKRYQIFLSEEETGKIVMDLHDIPEHVVEQIALFLGKVLPMAAAVRAGVDAIRSLQHVGEALNGAIGSLSPPKRRKGIRK